MKMPCTNELKRFLIYPLSKEDFIKEYKKISSRKSEVQNLYSLLIAEIGKATSEGNVEHLKCLSTSIDYINNVESKDLLNSIHMPNKNSNLVILACKHNKIQVLKYILSSGYISGNFFINGNLISPDDTDEMSHNAFYYAIRSSNVDLLDTVINKWPANYFTIHLKELDIILSEAYEELKLKNILLSTEIEIYIETKLMNLRFFSTPNKIIYTNKKNYSNIVERVKLLLQNIMLLRTEYNDKDVDEKFLYIAKFIAQNIHILKRRLKSTYCKLPWEEIEFCIISFVASHMKKQEINLFTHAVLNKKKILNYLKLFSNIFEDQRITEDEKLQNFNDLPNMKRDKIVADIIENNPQLEELYDDYQQLRDIQSLRKMNSYINLALSSDPESKDGQLIIIRVLQIIGEYLKNTLESPKLSSATSDLLLLSLPTDTRDIIIDLRNSLSHAYSLSKRNEIETNADLQFFIGIQNDTKKVGNKISKILHNQKMKLIRILLKKIIFSENLDEIREITETFDMAELDNNFEYYEMQEYESLKKLIEDLSNNIPEKSNHEKQLFNKINKILNSLREDEENNKLNFILGFTSLTTFKLSLTAGNTHVHGMKCRAQKILIDISPKIEQHNLKEIIQLSRMIFYSASPRLDQNNVYNISKLLMEIFCIIEFDTKNIKWIQNLREIINKKLDNIPSHKQFYNITEEQYNYQLDLKVLELKSILKKNSIDSQIIANFSLYKSNEKLQAVIEMLVLDIMSILGCSNNYLENNLLFIEDNAPMLTGKCLRNHLAHYNDLVDVLLCDPSKAVILNADRLASENIIGSKKRIGKYIGDDPLKLETKFNKDLFIIANQEKMFIYLEEGNIKGLEISLNKGADINARNVNLKTALHFAAIRSDVEIVKFIFNQNSNLNGKDINGQSPLHVAAFYGQKYIVEYFIKEAGLFIDDIDNARKTPLHIAAQNGHKDVVMVLLQNEANTLIQDLNGLSPLYYAVRNCNVDIVNILLEKDINVDSNEAAGGFTALHEAAESGHLKLVNIFLDKGANANARNDRGWTPLHAASRDGYPEIVKALIFKGANVDAKVINGCTSLHYAAENGHETIVEILLENGATINACTKTGNMSPLHSAALNGHEIVVNILLKHKADINITNSDGMTSLHYAACEGHLKMAITLLKHVIDINIKDKCGNSPLHYASENGHKDIVELLLKNNALVDIKTDKGFAPLHLTTLKSHKDVIQLLLKYNADINVKTSDHLTVLHIASKNCSEDIINTLLNHKAEVDARDVNGCTPLEAAVEMGHEETVTLLIKNKANINTKNIENITPLHVAAFYGHVKIINILIQNKALVNAKDINGNTPLHTATEAGYDDAVRLLITNGAGMNAKNLNNSIPLFSAIKCNYKKIVKVFIENGMNVNFEGGKPLFMAVFAGYIDIIKILITKKAYVNKEHEKGLTLLHVAAMRGHNEIVNFLIENNANVNAKNINHVTPLYIAADNGFDKIVEILMKNGASAYIANSEGNTPLHVASVKGHINVVKALLDNKTIVDIKDYEKRSSLELAISYGHLEVVKALSEHTKIDINAEGNGGYTILHIAAQENRLEIVKYLLSKGANINAKNASDSRPIHIAAREGCKDVVEFLLKKGCTVNDLGNCNQTLLHYSVMKGHMETVKYLIALGADVNAKDTNLCTPIQLAINFNFIDIVRFLLENGASVHNIQPEKFCKNKAILNLLASTEGLTKAVKLNDPSQVDNYIKAGACVNSRNTENGTHLHYAAWKGFNEVVDILLQYKADANVISNNNGRYTPLHYAAKFSHLKIVKALLSNGAIYNAASSVCNKPLDLTVDKSIVKLLKLVDKSFKNVKNKNCNVISNLNQIKDIDTVKAILNALNEEHKTLLDVAVQNNFPKVEQLKAILQDGASTMIDKAWFHANQCNYKEAISIFEDIYEKRKKLFGPNNPATLDIQVHIAKILLQQGALIDAFSMFEEICQKQKAVLGFNNKDTLRTRSTMALILHYQGKNEEALRNFEEIYNKQKEILGTNDTDTLETQLHLALVLDVLQKYEEALRMNEEVYKKRKETNHPAALLAQNNIALVLSHQGKYEKALKIYQKVLQKKKASLGANHAHTLRTSYSIAAVFFNQKKYSEALKIYQEVLSAQEKELGPYNPDTLNTQKDLGTVLFAQSKLNGALRILQENLIRRNAVYGENHITSLKISSTIETIKLLIKMEGNEDSKFYENVKKDIIDAASMGNMQTIQSLIKYGADVNEKDADGRTPLHFAAANNHIDVVNYLLTNGADIQQVTNKGNTVLHIAASKGYKEVLEVLLHHESRNKLNNFINAQTLVGGTTALHISAKNGFFGTVSCLLKYGACYNIKNKDGYVPVYLSKNQNVINILKLVEELFENAKNNSLEVVSKIQAAKLDELSAILNARNSQGNTLLQIAITNKHNYITKEILKMIIKLNTTS